MVSDDVLGRLLANAPLDLKDRLKQSRAAFQEAKLSDTPRGLAPHAGILGIALELAKDMTEDEYNSLTDRIGFETAYHGALSAFTEIIMEGKPNPYRAEQAYRILDAVCRRYNREDKSWRRYHL